MSGTGRSEPPAPPEAPVADPELDEAAYGTKVEEAFIEERGTPFLLSPKDWALIRGWREAGIPVETVMRAVHETFEKRRSRGQSGKIGSIAYCDGAVEERWEMERRGLVGRGDGLRNVPPADAGDRLSRLAAALDEALERTPPGVDPGRYRKALASAVAKVRALGPDGGFDALEAALSDIERALLKSLEKGLDETTRAGVDGRAASALGEPYRLSLEARDRMRRALVRREIRRAMALPPVTLFDV